MTRTTAIAPLDLDQTPAAAQASLQAVHKMLGGVPNLFRVTAHAPAALEAMVALFGATAKASLKARVREQIAMTVAQLNGCDYCLSAHTALGAGAGLSPEQLAAARDAMGTDAKTTAVLRFARTLVTERGDTSDAQLAAVREAGVSDAEILETVAVVVLNIFTNYVNLVADTPIDFPVVRSV
jgi:uncharacterized peroxidase-related enzyme